jgi:aminopeptidase
VRRRDTVTDTRVAKLAEILVDHCTEVRSGDTVQILAYSELAKPLVVEVYRRLLRRDAGEIWARIALEEFREALLDEASDERLGMFPELRMYLAEHTDVYIQILAPANTKLLSGFLPSRVARWRSSDAKVRAYLTDHTRWVVTLYPTPAAAQDAEMSLAQFEDFVFSATDQDWDQLARDQSKLKEVFDGSRELAIKGEETDLRMRVEGRTFVSADGKVNMPDGELFSGPIEDSVEGHIAFSYPAIYPAFGGREVEGIHLWFERGQVVKATASKGEDYLLAMLDLDAGSRCVGEIGLGNNYRIERFIKNILFDEKIGGTVHLALGRGYPETGSSNESGIHWDMIKDLRGGGEIYVDSVLVQKDGQWVY